MTGSTGSHDLPECYFNGSKADSPLLFDIYCTCTIHVLVESFSLPGFRANTYGSGT